MEHAHDHEAPPSSGGKSISRNVIAALPVPFLLPFVAALATALGAFASRPRVSTMALFMMLVTTLLVGFVTLTRRRTPRAGVLAACHALAWAPFIGVCAWQAIDTALVQESGFRCGTGLMGLIMLAVPIGGFALLVLGIAAGALLAHRATDGALRSAAVVATALAVIAFAFAAPRMKRPDPDTYLDSLQLAGEIRADSETSLLGRRFDYRRVVVTDPVAPAPAPGEAPVEPPPPRIECRLTGLAATQTYYPDTRPCPTLRVRVDQGHDLAVIDGPELYSLAYTSAFRPSTGEQLAIAPITVADHIGPPIGWTISAALGALAGAAFLLAARRVRRRTSAWAGVDGEHVGNGAVVLANGDRILVDAAAPLPVGAVVLGGAQQQLPTYRLMGVRTFASARPGTLAAFRSARTDLAASLDAIAIAAAALGATPLVVARIAGVF
jgi:hypothetical protein